MPVKNLPIAVALLACLAPVLLAATAVAQEGGAGDDWSEDFWGAGDVDPQVEIHGFVEAALGARVVDNPLQPDDLTLGESRLRLELTHRRDAAKVSAKLDVVGDGRERDVALEMREARAWWAPADRVEVAVGRQMLTWGTGDLLFLNDLFPKDYESFFVGRADEYLKTPVDAVKIGVFPGSWSIDLVWMPWFAPDRIIDGEPLSYFDPVSGVTRGARHILDPVEPRRKLRNGEFAARVAATVQSVELALYGYQGFSKQPQAITLDGNLMHARQTVGGANVRTPLGGGLANIEVAYTHSNQDPRGDRPRLPNSQVRLLGGYERELWMRFVMGLQYLAEATLQHDALLATAPPVPWLPDAWRHTITLRLHWRSSDERWQVGAFVLAVPSDVDAYLRPTLAYVPLDGLEVAFGGNVMLGRDNFTPFGQLKNDSNVYSRVRYSF